MMHEARCIDPKTQTGGPQEGTPDWACRTGRPGHCRKCPYRGRRMPTVLARAVAFGPSVQDYDESFYTKRPDTDYGGGRTMDEEVANFLWPPHERGWIEREGRWAERAAYHLARAEQEYVRELERELYDLRFLSDTEGGGS